MNSHTHIHTQALTNLTSLISTSFIVLSNFLISMSSTRVINANVIVLFVHNILDLVLHFRVNDALLNIHHLLIVNGTLYYYLSDITLTLETKKLIAWLFLAELSSFYNALRYNLKNTVYYPYSKMLFGLIFLVVRFYSSFGVIGWLIHNDQDEHIIAYSIISTIYIILNVLWGGMIIKQCIHQRNTIYTMITGNVSRENKRRIKV
jgi:hypothetical protein